MTVLVGLALAAGVLAHGLLDPEPASPWRHALLLPVVVAALGGGMGAGTVAAVIAVLLQAPFVLPRIEQTGLSSSALDGLASLALLVMAGALTGRLASHAHRARERHETLVVVQRALAGDVALDAALPRLRACLTRRLGAADVAIAVREGERLVIAGGDDVAPGSPVQRVLESGEAWFAPDAGGGRRPRRVLVVPLRSGDRTLGALAVEREADIPAEERAALEALGAYIALGLDNAWLASRQRRFTEELAVKIAEATRRLAETDQMKSDFVAIASHELRTPLTALNGFSELLETRVFPADEVRRMAGIMRAETERLSRIVGDFLDLSRLERGLTPALRRRPLETETAVAEALAIFARGPGARRVDIDCVGPLPPLDADPDALDRVLRNLVSNAIKYSPVSSCVRVRVRPAARDGGVQIEVEDEGDGIALEDLARVFEPYYRAPDAMRAARGAGLGLAVVKSLVEAHGGTIHAARGEARGTRMTLVMPAVP
jgi:two-component system, OmpR family, sensor histidine kinase KdpD